MPNGWDEFLEKAKQHAASEEPRALQAVWSDFLQLSRQSPRAEALQLLTQAVQKAPLDQRASVAIMMATLLAPLEWPHEWEQYRFPLVEALEGLSDLMSIEDPGSLAALVRSGTNGAILVSGAAVLIANAGRLLLTCRPDDLRDVANLCDVGLSQVIVVFKQELEKRAGQPLEATVLQARIRFDAAVDRYAQVARALNSAAGEVLFRYLDWRLGDLGA